MTAAGAGAFDALARSYLRNFPEEAARYIETASLEEAVGLLESEPTPQAVAVIERLASNVAADVLQAAAPESASRILAGMDPVRAAASVAWIEGESRQRILGGLPPRVAKELRQMAEYPAETAGRLMDPRVVGLRRGTTVSEAIRRLRAVRKRQVADVFLTEEDGMLAGRIRLQDLVVATPTEVLDALAEPAVSVVGTATADEVVGILTDRRLSSIPVVDFEGRLLGVIRHDTLVKTAQQDLAADIQTMVGASRNERALSRVTFAVRARLPWRD
jgi:magnesium transporter